MVQVTVGPGEVTVTVTVGPGAVWVTVAVAVTVCVGPGLVVVGPGWMKVTVGPGAVTVAVGPGRTKVAVAVGPSTSFVTVGAGCGLTVTNAMEVCNCVRVDVGPPTDTVLPGRVTCAVTVDVWPGSKMVTGSGADESDWLNSVPKTCGAGVADPGTGESGGVAIGSPDAWRANMNAASRMPATETPAVAIATSRREFSIDPPPPPPHTLSRPNTAHHTAAP